MTISSAVNKVSYTANGTSKNFTVPFYFIYKSDLKVYRMNGHVQELLTLDTDYTIIGTPEQQDGSIYRNGGTVVMSAMPTAGTRFVILREVPLTQEADYQEGSTFPAALHELALDKLTMAVQQLEEKTDRAVTVDVFSGTDPSSLVSEIETIYNIKDEVVTVAENSSRIKTCSESIAAIIDAPNQANLARNSAIEATNSAVTAQLMSDLASENATTASASAGAAEQSAIQASVNAKNGHVVGEIVSVFGTSSYVPFGCVLADGTEYTKALFPSVWSDYIKGESVGNAYCWVYNDNTNLYTLKSNPSVGDYLYFYTNGILTTRCIVTSVVDANTLTMRNIGINDILTVTRNSAGDLSNVSIPLLPTTDYSQYQNEITACGQCAMFAVDPTNEKFKVPTIKDGGYLTQALSVGEIGRAYNESLPNIVGDSVRKYMAIEGGTPTGAIKINSISGTVGPTANTYALDNILVDASASSSTYQNGAKVQGDNVRVRFFVCLAGGVINESMIDWQNYITALAGKTNTDLSNVTAAGKSAAAGWGMPYYNSSLRVNLSGYNSVSNKFTAPCDGLIVMCGGGTANNAFNLVIDDEVYLFNNASTTYWVGQQFFIRKGSNFYYFGTLPEYGMRHFFPMEGAQ